ncbi:unnamed protein product, partial [Laminaria digitata]
MRLRNRWTRDQLTNRLKAVDMVVFIFDFHFRVVFRNTGHVRLVAYVSPHTSEGVSRRGRSLFPPHIATGKSRQLDPRPNRWTLRATLVRTTVADLSKPWRHR